MEKSAWGQGSLGKVNIITLATLLPTPIIISLMMICQILPVSGSGVVWTGLNSALLVPDTPDTLDRMVLGRGTVWTLARYVDITLDTHLVIML